MCLPISTNYIFILLGYSSNELTHSRHRFATCLIFSKIIDKSSHTFSFFITFIQGVRTDETLFIVIIIINILDIVLFRSFTGIISSFIHSISSFIHSISSFIHSISSFIHSISSFIHSISSFIHSISSFIHSISSFIHSISSFIHSISLYIVFAFVLHMSY